MDYKTLEAEIIFFPAIGIRLGINDTIVKTELPLFPLPLNQWKSPSKIIRKKLSTFFQKRRREILKECAKKSPLCFEIK
ncbi:hypothetical protein CV632_12265 [Geobacillus thermodenitrificans]|nr:hypothetical protein CV632_12265 [Geobacillus thermodenitrificans]